MVFMSGPRQVGKTTLAKSYGDQQGGALYFSWDDIRDQKKLAKNPYFFEETDRKPHNLIIFDEIHKYSRWKNYLKGAFDKYGDEFSFIVTGSGRLDLYKKGGDSLFGRYISLPMFPFTLGELGNNFHHFDDWKKTLREDLASCKTAADNYNMLFNLNGFPDPLMKGEKSFLNVWQQERRTLLFKQDIRDATNIRQISLLEMMSQLVIERIGSPLSINSLREDVGVAFETARDWVQILSQFYFLFLVHPYSATLKRALRKETKVYLFDWSEIDNEAIKFENLVACHLLKAVKTWKSVGDGTIGLSYLRDKDKREVDFVITEKNKPFCLIEAKLAENQPTPALVYYQDKLNIPYAIQVVHKTGIKRKIKRNQNNVLWIISADNFLQSLP